MELAMPVSSIYDTIDNKALFMHIGMYQGKPSSMVKTTGLLLSLWIELATMMNALLCAGLSDIRRYGSYT